MGTYHIKVKKSNQFWQGHFQLFSLSVTLLQNFPLSLGNQRSGLPGESISLPVLCAANTRRPRISNLHRYYPFRVPIHTLLGDLCAQRNSRKDSVVFEQRTPRSPGERATTGPTRPVNVRMFILNKSLEFIFSSYFNEVTQTIIIILNSKNVTIS